MNDLFFLTDLLLSSSGLYLKDVDCPLRNWEPSGSDFLSPCLQEADYMRFLLGRDLFLSWLQNFLPDLLDEDFTLEPGKGESRISA